MIGKRRLTAYPTADVVLLPRHIAARTVDVRLTAETLAPAAVGRILPHVANAARVLVATPARRVVEWFFGALWGTSTNGEAAVAFDETAFDIVVRGTASKRTREARASGAAIYDLTARIVADAALLLGRVAAEKAGVLSPAQFFEPRRFLQDLGAYGVLTSA
jgi:hypothetical protein